MIPALVGGSAGMSQVTSLFFLVSGISLFDQLKNALTSGKDIVKMKASGNVRGLIRLLNHRNPDVQYEAAEALGEIRDASAVCPLVAILTGDSLSGVRWKAAEALSRIGILAVDPLIVALKNPDDDVRWKVAMALGEIGDPRAIGPLIGLLADSDRFVKSRAALALGMIGEPAVDPLIVALQEGDGNQRWGAAIALGRIKDIRATEPLIRGLADKYENVRAEAAAALAAIGTPSIAPLLQFLKYAEGTARIEVVNALGDLQAGDALGPLIQMLEKADEHERRAIADAVDAILTPSAESLAKRIWNTDLNEKEEGNDGTR
jgi:HEAT repeat protein